MRPLMRPLFTPADPFVRAALDSLPDALDGVMPLSRAHRADLPDAIRELSALLTTERAGLTRSYWSAPRFVSAYLRYFLPWNLVRLTHLLPGLVLPALPPGGPVTAGATQGGTGEDAGEGPAITVADLGSGPLTLPLALWLARPEWRAVPLTLVCADTAPRPMELGRRLLEEVAARAGEPLRWSVRLVRAPFARALREVSRPRLILAGNVLNEARDKGGEILSGRMAELALSLERALPSGGAALFVEPGTRLGGTLTATVREAALEEGLTPLAPCPHDAPCPLLGRRSRGWCHVSQDFGQQAGGPAWLAALSRAAGLPKDSFSLSFVLLGRKMTRPAVFAGDEEKAAPAVPAGTRARAAGREPAADGTRSPLPERIAGRVLSDAFPVPGMGYARYACTAQGLAILPDAGSLASGALVACRRPAAPRRDGKSGAAELHWEAESPESSRPAGRRGRQPQATRSRSGDAHD